jgi:hypothetical protein
VRDILPPAYPLEDSGPLREKRHCHEFSRYVDISTWVRPGNVLAKTMDIVAKFDELWCKISFIFCAAEASYDFNIVIPP